LKEGLTWSFFTSSAFSLRWFDCGFLWDVIGSPMFINDEKLRYYVLAFMNTVVVSEFLRIINPTVAYQAVDLQRVPLEIQEETYSNVTQLSKGNVSLSRADWDSFETSWDFRRHPLLQPPPPVGGTPFGEGGLVGTGVQFSVQNASYGEQLQSFSGGTPFSEGGLNNEVRPYDASLTQAARELRKSATRQENHLWYDFLRNFKPRFTRQRIFGNYILDFYCAEAKLAIELDGSQHFELEAMKYDQARTEFLNSYGVKVIRFTNTQIDRNFNAVCETIKEAVTPAPFSEGGAPEGRGLFSEGGAPEGRGLFSEGGAPEGRGLLSAAFAKWQHEAAERFNTLKANEEELNRIFIDIYGLQDELTPEVEDKDVTVRRADLGREIRSLISYAVGCMFGRYSLDCEGLAYAGGEWEASKYSTIIPDKDNILPICDDEYFDDDIAGRFVAFVKTVYGKDTLEENLKFIADALGGRGTPREVIRNYFLNDFYKDHCKIYQKRPIYWQFDSGKKNGFKALIYMHRYSRDLLAKLRTDYVHEQQERYRTQLSHIATAMNTATGAERARLLKQQDKISEQAREIGAYEEKIHHLADMHIAIDLDDGVKKNYEIFADVLAKI
jgi:very-short-patch-repair endonuclease